MAIRLINIRRFFALLTLVAFMTTSVPSSYAQALSLPDPGQMVNLSSAFNPPVLKGIKVHADNPFQFEFILDQGDSKDTVEALKDQSSHLIKYFLAALTVPENDLWVNLSPYEKDRIITNEFGMTEMGRDLLAQDYLLKQVTASVIYPEGEVGKKFWDKVYKRAFKNYGTTDVPVNTFNKVWIVPAEAVVYERRPESCEAKRGSGLVKQEEGGCGNSAVAYVVKAKLKVMLESDYLAAQKSLAVTEGPKKRNGESQELAKTVMREIVIPVLEKEVNDGRNFAPLRQVYHSLVLAAWYKRKIKDSLLSAVYVDQKKVQGVNIDDPKMAERIWGQYVEAFKEGVFNYIKEEREQYTDEVIPRKYFSGGFDLAMEGVLKETHTMPDAAMGRRDFLKILAGTTVALAGAKLSAAAPARPVQAQSPRFAKEDLNRDELLVYQLVNKDRGAAQKAYKELEGRGKESLKPLLSILEKREHYDLYKEALIEQLERDGAPPDVVEFLKKTRIHIGNLFSEHRSEERIAKWLKMSLRDFQKIKRVLSVYPTPDDIAKQIVDAIRKTGKQEWVLKALQGKNMPKYIVEDLVREWGGWYVTDASFMLKILGGFVLSVGGGSLIYTKRNELRRSYLLAAKTVSGQVTSSIFEEVLTGVQGRAARVALRTYFKVMTSPTVRRGERDWESELLEKILTILGKQPPAIRLNGIGALLTEAPFFNDSYGMGKRLLNELKTMLRDSGYAQVAELVESLNNPWDVWRVLTGGGYVVQDLVQLEEMLTTWNTFCQAEGIYYAHQKLTALWHAGVNVNNYREELPKLKKLIEFWKQENGNADVESLFSAVTNTPGASEGDLFTLVLKLATSWRQAGGDLSFLFRMVKPLRHAADRQALLEDFDTLVALFKSWEQHGGDQNSLAAAIEALDRPMNKSNYRDIFKKLSESIGQWAGPGWDANSFSTAISFLRESTDGENYTDVFKELIAFKTSWSEAGVAQKDAVSVLRAVSEKLNKTNYALILGRLKGLWQSWNKLTGSADSFLPLLANVSVEQQYEELLEALKERNTAASYFLGLITSAAQFRKFDPLFDALLSAGRPAEILRRVYEKLSEDGLKFTGDLGFLNKDGREAAFANVTGLNIKLYRYLIRKGGWARLKDGAFRERINTLAYLLNREKTIHPSQRRLGEDEKTSLFDLLFSAGSDIEMAKRIFDEFFANDPDSYSVELEDISRLLSVLSLDELDKIIRLIKDDPKLSLEEVLQGVRRSVEGQPNADFIVREFGFIASNLLVLEGQLDQLRPIIKVFKADGRSSADLVAFLGSKENKARMSLSKAKNIVEIAAQAAEYQVAEGDALLLKLETLSQSKKEELIVNALLDLNKIEAGQSELYDIVVNAFLSQPLESRRMIYFKLLFMLTTDNARLKRTIDELLNGDEAALRGASPWARRFLGDQVEVLRQTQDFHEYWRMAESLTENNLKKEAFGQLRAIYDLRKPKKFSSELARIISGTIERAFNSLQDQVALPSQASQIPHVFFESLLRLQVTDQVIEQFRILTRAMNESKPMRDQLARSMNDLYEKMSEFASLNVDKKGTVFSNILAALITERGMPAAANVQDFHTELLRLLDAFSEIIRTQEQAAKGAFATKSLNDDLLSMTKEVLNDLLVRGVLNEQAIERYKARIATLSAEKLLARLGGRIKVDDKDKADLFAYFTGNPRAAWADHQKRKIFDLLDLYLSHITDEEIFQNMFNDLMAEARGRFPEHKYSSPDYTNFLEEAIRIFALDLPTEEQKRFKEAMAGAEGRDAYQKLMGLPGYDALKERINKVRNWEKTFTKALGEGVSAAFTDDFYLLMNIGNYPGSTACQSITYSSDLNRGLTGYVSNGTIKAMTLVDDRGRVVPSRRIVRIGIANIDGRKTPALFIEESTQFGINGLQELYSVMDEVSRRTGLPVVTSTYRPAEMIQGKIGEQKNVSLYISGGFSSYVYSDAYGGRPMYDQSNAEVRTYVSSGLYRLPTSLGTVRTSEVSAFVKAPVEGTGDSKVIISGGSYLDYGQDQAMVAENGGIDLNRLDKTLTIGTRGETPVMRFNFDPAMLEEYRAAPGFTPVILNIAPETDLRTFLGLNDEGLTTGPDAT